MNGRIYTIFILIIIFAATIVGRLFYLQIINHKFYQAQALGQQALLGNNIGERGEIFFKNPAKSLAVCNDKILVYVNSVEIQDQQSVSDNLSQIIQETKAVLLEKIKNGDSYTVINNKLSEEQAKKIQELKMKGVYLNRSPGRYYPQQTIASQVAGFVSGDGVGQYGLEGYYEDILSGEQSLSQQSRSLALFNLNNLTQQNLDGADLYLTIDYNIQYEAESLLKKANKDFEIDGGQIIVMDPNTGEIVAMAEKPNFNPNKYSQEKDFDIFQNFTVQKIFEPGSVMKSFTMAIGLNEGKITPTSTYIDEGFVKIGDKTISNFLKNKKYGLQTMTEVLEKSLNTGAVFIEKTMPHGIFLQYLDEFGFGEKTGIDLQGEVMSQNNNLRDGGDVNFATASFGQGIGATPIQLVRAFSAIANGGKILRPYVVSKIVNANQEEIETPVKIIRTILNQQTISQLTTMLISTVSNGAKNARVPGYYVAGKTGTAQVPYPDRAGYYPDRTINSFIGFAPALNPRFVILVKLDNVRNGRTAEGTSSFIFSKLAQYVLNYWQIPPDHKEP